MAGTKKKTEHDISYEVKIALWTILFGVLFGIIIVPLFSFTARLTLWDGRGFEDSHLNFVIIFDVLLSLFLGFMTAKIVASYEELKTARRKNKPRAQRRKIKLKISKKKK